MSCHINSQNRQKPFHQRWSCTHTHSSHQSSARMEVVLVALPILGHVLITALVRLSVVKEFDFQFAKSNKSEYIFCCEIKIINYNPIMLLYIHPPIYTLFSVDSTPPLHPISICSLDGCWWKSLSACSECYGAIQYSHFILVFFPPIQFIHSLWAFATN